MNQAFPFLAMICATVASPGPGVMMSLDNAATLGWRPSLYGIAGLAVGAAVMAGLSAAGVGLLVQASPAMFKVLSCAGAGYLWYLAYRAWRRSGAAGALPAQRQASGMHQPRPHQLLLRGALLQTSNPKSLLFFVSVLPQLAAADAMGGTPTTRLLAGIAAYCGVLVCIHAVYAGLAARARRWLLGPVVARTMARLSAAMFGLFGIAMLLR